MSISLSFQTIRYVLVGGIVYALDIGLFTVIVMATPDLHLAANGIAKVTSAATGWVLHKYVTFSWNQRDGWLRQMIGYAVLFAVNTTLSTGIIYLAVDVLSLSPFPSKIAADVVVTITAFHFSRSIVFRAQPATIS